MFRPVIFITVRIEGFPCYQNSLGAPPRIHLVLPNGTANENCKTHGLHLIGPFCNNVIPLYVNIPT